VKREEQKPCGMPKSGLAETNAGSRLAGAEGRGIEGSLWRNSGLVGSGENLQGIGAEARDLGWLAARVGCDLNRTLWEQLRPKRMGS
jgi:hypothetical protein